MSKIILISALIFGMAAAAVAQQAALNGQWRLNQAKSFLAGDHPPADYVLVLGVKIAGDSMELVTTAQNAGDAMYGLPRSKSKIDTPIDGKPHEASQPGFLPGMPETPITIRAEWQGETLLVEQTGGGFGGVTRTRRRFFVSGEQKRLVELVESHSTFGDSEQRLVFDKQD